jgi:hypothetical protein
VNVSARAFNIRRGKLMSLGMALGRCDKRHARSDKVWPPDHGVRARRQAWIAKSETSPAIGELCKRSFLGEGVRGDSVENGCVVLTELGIAAQKFPGEIRSVEAIQSIGGLQASANSLSL